MTKTEAPAKADPKAAKAAEKAAAAAKATEAKAAAKAKADAAAAAKATKAAEAKAKADAKAAEAKAKADAKKAEAAAAAAAKKAAALEAKAAKKKAADEKKAAAKAAREEARKPRVDVAELKVRLKEKEIAFGPKDKEDALVALANQHEIAIPMLKVGSNIVPNEYRERYGAEQTCADDVANALKAATSTTTKTAKGKDKTVVDYTKLLEVGTQNGVDVEARWGGLNIGMRRMNLGNVLRGKINNGEKVKIGKQTFKGEKEGAGAAL